jgi:hypothetical protein
MQFKASPSHSQINNKGHMSNWKQTLLKVIKETDEAAFTALTDSIKSAGLSIQQITIEPTVGGDPISIVPNPTTAEISIPDEIATMFSEQSYLVGRISINFAGILHLILQREQDQPSDLISINLSNLSSQPHRANRHQINILYKSLRERLKPIDTLALRTHLDPGNELQKHYEIRETELAKLQSILTRATAETTSEALKVRTALEAEYSKRNENLSKDYEAKALELSNKEADLQKRLKEVDDRESRHARRQLRQVLKEELARRSQKFELTQGTRRLRTPINAFSGLLLLLFGAGLITYSYLNIAAITSGQALTPTLLISSIAKQLAFGLAFGSTAIFFIRWNSRWFQTHADEEFRQKRFELDLDRASWVVEMAMEWKEDKGTEIPPNLLSHLTTGLFQENTPAEEKLHPADQLASAILGASAETAIELPGGTKVRLDRKSMKDLSSKS